MTAELFTWGGDSVPDAVTLAPATDSSYYLTQRKARELTDSIRGSLAEAAALLELAREGHAHLALGYTHFHLYCQAEFGSLTEMRLPVATRRALVASMCDAGASVSDIVKALGFSRGCIQADRVALKISDAQPRGQVVPIREEQPNPYAGMGRKAEALARVAAQGARGLTSTELDLETSWPMGSATGALSKLDRRGLVARTEQRRGNRAAYVVTDAGAAALEEDA
jgi:hypothetical protein